MNKAYSYVVAAGALLSAGAAQAQNDPALVERARAIHERVIAIDTHVDIPVDFGTEAYDFNVPGKRGQQVHIPTMFEGGLDAPFLIVYVGQGKRDIAGYAQARSDAFAKFAGIHRTVNQYPDRIELALTAGDVRRIIAAGKKAVLIGIENGGYPLAHDIGLLDTFYTYGARYFGLVHNGHNDLADSWQPSQRLGDQPEEHGGLSDLGKQVVARLNELGIMVDVSHSSAQSTLDMITLSKAPVIGSHSAARGFYDHGRSLTDANLDALKVNGGVTQVVALDSFLGVIPPERAEAVSLLWKELGVAPGPNAFDTMTPEQVRAYDARMIEIENRWPRPNVRTMVDHIDYVKNRIGVDHVGIASDFNGGGGIPGWNSAAETFNLTLEMVRRGYTEEEIAKIWGGNLLRVMQAVQDYAAGQKRAR